MTREEAIRMLSNRDAHGVPCGYTSGYQEAFDMAIKALQAEPKHGEWERTYKATNETGEIEYWVECNCSLCGMQVTEIESALFNFCPNCGAKMDGGAE